MVEPGKKFAINSDEPFFVFDTHGEWHATLLNNCLWDARGEYIGFVRGQNYDVYTAYGQWIGNLTADGRIVRRRMTDRQTVLKVRKLAPQKPTKLPARAPLPPMTADLGYHYIDVLEWDPNAFRSVPELKSDMH
ncbi:MAG: hypothetical protein CL610_09580 [Anaerolineaceae bacterium]|nr:hypothetical protein [Anaerolineaceae bacterium]